MTTTKKKKTATKSNRGGKREGAGRKKGTLLTYDGEPLSSQATIRIRAVTYERIKKLRDLTKEDAMPFNRMFEAWVEEMAKDYGIE